MFEGQEGIGAERRTALHGDALKGEPHERFRFRGIGRQPREQTVKRVRNPEGGTNRAGRPGHVDLAAGAAVGAKNLMRVAVSLGKRRNDPVSPGGGAEVHGRRWC